MIDAAADEGEETDAYAGPEMPGLGDGAEVLCGHEQEDGCGKETDDGGAETLEGGFDGGVVAVAQKELAQQEHEDEAGEHHSEGGDETAQHSPPVFVAGIGKAGVAHKSGTVDAYGTRGALADGYDVGELSGSEPVMVGDHFALDHGEHGVTAPESEEPNLEEGPEQP